MLEAGKEVQTIISNSMEAKTGNFKFMLKRDV